MAASDAAYRMRFKCIGAKEGQEGEVEKMENASWRFTTTRTAHDKLSRDDVKVALSLIMFWFGLVMSHFSLFSVILL